MTHFSYKSVFFLFALLFFFSCSLHADPFAGNDEPIIVDHNCTAIEAIPVEYIDQARNELIIAYGHTSHGSQLITGMEGLDGFMQGKGYDASTFSFNHDGSDGALALHDAPFSNAYDLGNLDFTAWAEATRQYLNQHNEINVVMWSWCGQVSWASDDDINTYLSLMNDLEADFKTVAFVYMTGHLDGSGVDGTLNRNNNKIRDFCLENNKILYDFADIESYDPDGETNYMERYANDNCDYIDENDRERNWATEWQDAHTQGEDWYSCSAAHSQALNGNLKAYAAWWLYARLANWEPDNGQASSIIATDPGDVRWLVKNGNFMVEWDEREPVNTIRFFDRSGKMLSEYTTPSAKTGIQKASIAINPVFQHMNIFQIITTRRIISGKFASF
ncbi:MAG: hypothetical protein K9H26_05675 [Prolixibacteraceae bacterium]|nr:hypothetical protein [Prolixibacteraceae bacterium]